MAEPVTFDELGLNDEVLAAINKKGFEEPTAIQAKTIPVMLRDDTNIVAQAQTGTGKTAAFGLPLIQMIDPQSRTVQALILVPTRELANQVAEELNSLKTCPELKIVPIYGGQAIFQQFRRLKSGIHIVVGTPGRIIDHLNRKTLKLGEIEHLILDEADEMLNMGFVEDMEEIMKHTSPEKRTLLFSATIPKRIRDLAHTYMDGYQLLTVEKEQLTSNLTEQIYFEVKGADKFEALCRIIDIEEEFYSLIFCRTKNDVDIVAGHLIDRGYEAEAIHGDMSQQQREKTMSRFKQQKINILVATDVAARGLDVKNLTHVINYALPQNPESYVHRIGRTGRAGNLGTAITFITPSEYSRLMRIQRYAKADIKKLRVPSVEEIIEAKKKRISEDLTVLYEENHDSSFFEWAKALLKEAHPTVVVASLLNYAFEDEINPDSYGTVREPGPKSKQVDLEGKARLFVARGKRDKMTPKRLIELVQSKVPIKSKRIKDIQIMDKFSFMTVPFEKAEDIIHKFHERGRSLITHAKKE